MGGLSTNTVVMISIIQTGIFAELPHALFIIIILCRKDYSIVFTVISKTKPI